jgi:hypothetical protein
MTRDEISPNGVSYVLTYGLFFLKLQQHRPQQYHMLPHSEAPGMHKAQKAGVSCCYTDQLD